MLVSQVTQQHSSSSFLPTGACGSTEIHRALARINDCRDFTFILVFVGKLFWVQSEILTLDIYTNVPLGGFFGSFVVELEKEMSGIWRRQLYHNGRVISVPVLGHLAKLVCATNV